MKRLFKPMMFKKFDYFVVTNIYGGIVFVQEKHAASLILSTQLNLFKRQKSKERLIKNKSKFKLKRF